VRRFGTAICWLGIAFAPGGAVLADGVIRDGLGAISCGRGGTNIAAADNGVVLLDNPAVLANVNGCGLIDVGADLLFTDMAYADPENDAIIDHDPYPCGQLALVRKSRDGCWAFGLGLFSPAAFGSRYHLKGPPPWTGTRYYKSFGALSKILPGVACRVTDRLSVGGTLGVGVSHVELEGPYFLQSPPLRGTPTMMDLQATGATIAWSAGLQYQVTSVTTVGIAYQSQSRFHLDGSMAVDVPELGHCRFDADVDMRWPRSLGVGMRHEVCPHRSVSADVIWYNWSEAFDQIGIHLSNPSNPAFEYALGPSLDEVFPLAWRDTVSVRLGYEHAFRPDRVARFGYTYHRNPIPAGTLTPYIQTTLEHTFSIGYGWLQGAWSVDLAYQFTFGPGIDVASSDLAGGDFDASHHESRVHVMLVTFSKRF